MAEDFKDYTDYSNLMEERRAAIEKNVERIGKDSLEKLGMQLFPALDHPWHETYFTFIHENANCSFFHAQTHDGVHVVYCREKNKGIWYIPDKGLGPLQARGLVMMQEITAQR